MKIEIQSQPGIALLLVSALSFFTIKLVADPTAKPIARGAPIAQQPQSSLATGTNAPHGEPLASAPLSAPITNSSKTDALHKEDLFTITGFDKLAAFTFTAGTDAQVSPENAGEASRQIMAQIPASIKALNEKRVVIRGFMLPMKLDHGLVTEFLLLRNQMGCCYGVPPGMNEVIDVRISGKGVPALMDDLITVYGTLHISEVRESGYLTGIYKLDCERVQ